MSDKKRNAFIDYARILASLGIAGFHTLGEQTWLGFAGLPLFMVLVVYFNLQSGSRLPYPEFARSRATRMLIPWASWCAIYAVAKIAQALVEGRPIISEFEPWMVLGGTQRHLWFLPFAFASMLVLSAVLRRWTNHHRLYWILLAAYVPVFLLMVLLLKAPAPMDPVSKWIFMAPAIMMGILFYVSGGSLRRHLLVLGLTLAAFYLSRTVDFSYQARQLLVCAAISVTVLNIYIPSHRLSRVMGEISFGVYLSHQLVNAICIQLLPIKPQTPEMMVTVCVLSMLLSFAISRTPVVRRYL